MPIKVDSVSKDTCYESKTLSFCQCVNCNSLFVGDRVSPEILYENGHNNEIVGGIWYRHFIVLSEFMWNCQVKGRVLEIGDPAAKLAKHYHSNVSAWDIVEPNPSIENFENIVFFKSFFEDFVSNGQSYDCIVASHMFEHAYNPNLFLKLLKGALKPNGQIILSIPNMAVGIETNISPVGSLHFEHTFYLDEIGLKALLARNRLRIKSSHWFENHSIFYSIIEDKDAKTVFDDVKTHNLQVISKFKDNCDKFADLCKKIDLLDGDVFLYGGHYASQTILSKVKNPSRIRGLLDKAKSKIGKYLYGTGLLIFDPCHVRDKKCTVVTSCTGPYRKEIEQALLDINPKVNLL
jgi:SAM-dependent methyltransferase